MTLTAQQADIAITCLLFRRQHSEIDVTAAFALYSLGTLARVRSLANDEELSLVSVIANLFSLFYRRLLIDLRRSFLFAKSLAKQLLQARACALCVRGEHGMRTFLVLTVHHRPSPVFSLLFSFSLELRKAHTTEKVHRIFRCASIERICFTSASHSLAG